VKVIVLVEIWIPQPEPEAREKVCKFLKERRSSFTMSELATALDVTGGQMRVKGLRISDPGLIEF
jgi:CO/xanthine dehydrogenase FAD-binding subunit